MRKVIRAAALVLALSVSASAGEMQCPPPQAAEQETAAGSAILTPSAGGETRGVRADPLTEIMLNLLQATLVLL